MLLKFFKNSVCFGFAATISFGATAAENFDVEIGGKRIEVTKASAKCDIGDTKKVSARRLFDCDSAKVISFRYDDRKKHVVKFTIKPTDAQISSGVRAELRDMHEAVNGEETWYHFATLLPRDESFPIDTKHRIVLAQWHERMRAGESLRPPLSHRLWDGRFVVTLWNQPMVDARGIMGDGEIIFEIPKIERGLWYGFKYRVKWSPDDDGAIDGWMRQCPVLDPQCGNGTPWKQIISYRGSTGYRNDLIKSYYFKLGLYTVTDFDASFTAYHRNYQRVDREEELSFPKPAN